MPQPDCARSPRPHEEKLMKAPRSAVIGLAAVVAFGVVVSSGRSSQESQYTFRSITPTGYEVITLEPSGATVSLLALVDCPEIQGAQQVSQGQHAKIVSAGGVTLSHFPRHFSFRVTATLRKTVIDGPSSSLTTPDDPRQFLLKLGFRLKAYNGLSVQEMAPDSVEMIGVPADVASDERVFRVNFDVGDRPITDRFVMEVFSPQGERMARFHFEML